MAVNGGKTSYFFIFTNLVQTDRKDEFIEKWQMPWQTLSSLALPRGSYNNMYIEIYKLFIFGHLIWSLLIPNLLCIVQQSKPGTYNQLSS